MKQEQKNRRETNIAVLTFAFTTILWVFVFSYILSVQGSQCNCKDKQELKKGE